jgi:hypothetical protein
MYRLLQGDWRVSVRELCQHEDDAFAESGVILLPDFRHSYVMFVPGMDRFDSGRSLGAGI